jgi:hypothetical protein
MLRIVVTKRGGSWKIFPDVVNGFTDRRVHFPMAVILPMWALDQ